MGVVKPSASGKVGPSPQLAGSGASAPGRETGLSSGIDLNNRDPRMINFHVMVQFEDVIGEPEGVRTMDCCWIKHHHCYTCCMDALYKTGSVLCGIPMATLYGCHFALTAFPHVWILTPLTVTCQINCKSVARFLKQCLLCVVGAPCEAVGELFWAFGKEGRRKPTPFGGNKATSKVTFSKKVKTRTIPARETNNKPQARRIPPR